MKRSGSFKRKKGINALASFYWGLSTNPKLKVWATENPPNPNLALWYGVKQLYQYLITIGLADCFAPLVKSA